MQYQHLNIYLYYIKIFLKKCPVLTAVLATKITAVILRIQFHSIPVWMFNNFEKEFGLACTAVSQVLQSCYLDWHDCWNHKHNIVSNQEFKGNNFVTHINKRKIILLAESYTTSLVKLANRKAYKSLFTYKLSQMAIIVI